MHGFIDQVNRVRQPVAETGLNMNVWPLFGCIFTLLLMARFIGTSGRLSVRLESQATTAHMSTLRTAGSVNLAWDTKSLALMPTDLALACSAHLFRAGEAWVPTVGTPWYVIKPGDGNVGSWLTALGITSEHDRHALRGKIPADRLLASLLETTDSFMFLMDKVRLR